MEKSHGGSKTSEKKIYYKDKNTHESVKSSYLDLLKSIKLEYSEISESYKIIAQNNDLNVNQKDYYNLYRSLLNSPKSIYDTRNNLTQSDLDNIKIISYSDYKEKLFFDKIYLRNILSTYYTDNIDIIDYINNNITLKKLKSIKKLSPIIEKSNENISDKKGGRNKKRILKKGGGGLKKEGEEFLSILHILDRKHDFIEGVNDIMTLYINNDSDNNIKLKLLNNIILRDKVLELYNTSKSKGYEDKIVLDILNKIMDNKYIENTANYTNFCFLDIGKTKEKLEIYELKKLVANIDIDNTIADDIYNKIIDKIKTFYEYTADPLRIKYLLDIDIKTNVNSLDRYVYPNIGTHLHPFEDVFDPHSSARIVVDPANIDLYRQITNANFNSPVNITENIYSAIRNITREYIKLQYYEVSPGVYYPALIFSKNIQTINIFNILITHTIQNGTNVYQLINSKVLYFFRTQLSSTEVVMGLYYKNSFNNVDTISFFINKILIYKNNKDEINFEAEFNDSIPFNITASSSPKLVITQLLIIYLYYTIKSEIGINQFDSILEKIINILFDFKKAGDWGQSLFCSKYNELTQEDCFFVSGDRLSAMRSILSTNVKTIFTTDYSIIDAASIEKQTIMSLYKNLNTFTFKKYVDYLKRTIFINDEYKYYTDEIIGQLFYRNTGVPFNEDEIITDANFENTYVIKIVYILKYLFINYLVKNSLIGIINKREIALVKPSERPDIQYKSFNELLATSVADINIYIDEIKRLNPNIEEILNIYISDYKNEVIPATININDSLKIFNDIANLNKLYNILFCHTSQSNIDNGISKIKEAFEENTKAITDFIGIFNAQFNNTNIMKDTISKYYVHKSLYESYKLFLEYSKMITYLDKIIPYIKPSKIAIFISKFRGQISISEDAFNYNIMLTNTIAYWNKISTIAGFTDTIDARTRDKYNKMITGKRINMYFYNYYIKTVLPYINKLYITPGNDGIKYYDKFMDECYDNLQSISAISKEPKRSFNILELRNIIEIKKRSLFDRYSELHKIMNDLYVFNIDTDLYFKDPKTIPETSNAVSIYNTIFKLDEEIPAPNINLPDTSRPAPQYERSSRKRKTESSSAFVLNTKNINDLHNLLIHRRKGEIEASLHEKSIVPSFLLNIKLKDDVENINSMLKQITLVTYIVTNLKSMQNPNNILTDLVSYLEGDYKIISFIKSNAITYFFSENYKVIDILNKYLKYIFEKIKIYISGQGIRDYGFKTLFNENSFTKLSNYSQQLDILYNTIHAKGADYKPPATGRGRGRGRGPGATGTGTSGRGRGR